MKERKKKTKYVIGVDSAMGIDKTNIVRIPFPPPTEETEKEIK